MAQEPTDVSTSKDVATVERVIAAPADRIFDFLADPDKHKVIDGSGTVVDAKSGSERLKLGSTFGMSMKVGIGYSMESTVIEFEEDRRIVLADATAEQGGGGLRRRAHLALRARPVEGGTKVTESWDITQEQQKWLVRPARKKTVEAMAKTLARIEELVTSPSS